jgi:hypothetical protein
MNMSVITAVNDMEMYKRNVRERLNADQFIPIEGAVSQSAALNEGIDRADNDICVLCHQDVIFPSGWVETLVLPESFGICGVWGVSLSGKMVGHVVEPRGHWKSGVLPEKAQSVDELLMIVKKSSGLRFDEALNGWHLSGADLCLQALDKGLKIYVIDNCVRHLSMGMIDSEFMRWKSFIENKWKCKSPVRNFITPNTEFWFYD